MSDFHDRHGGRYESEFPGNHGLEERLRRALRAEAEAVVPAGDGLARIRERTAGARPWWRPALAAVSAAALFGLAAGAGLALTRDGEGSTSNAAASPASLQATPPSPSESPQASAPAPLPPSASAPLPPSATASSAASTLPSLGTPATTKPPVAVVPSPAVTPSASREPTSRGTVPPSAPSSTAAPPAGTLPTAPTGGSVTVPVYYVQKVDGNVRLYREFHRAAQRENDAVTALDEMVGRPKDPDYSSLWSSGARAVTYQVKAGVATVGLSGAGRPGDLAVQQLVHTVTAADRRVDAVSIEVDGKVVTSGAVRRAPAIDVLGFIWIFDLEEGSSVARTFTLRGEASVFEAALQWEAVRNGAVASKGFMTASEGAPGRGSWSTKVELPEAGRYTIRVFTDSAKDGSAISVETKTVNAR